MSKGILVKILYVSLLYINVAKLTCTLCGECLRCSRHAYSVLSKFCFGRAATATFRLSNTKPKTIINQYLFIDSSTLLTVNYQNIFSVLLQFENTLRFVVEQHIFIASIFDHVVVSFTANLHTLVEKC